MFVMKFSTAGNLIYAKSFYTGDAGIGQDWATGVAVTSDDRYVFLVYYSFTYVNVGATAGANLRFVKIRGYDGAMLSAKGSNSGGDDRMVL